MPGRGEDGIDGWRLIQHCLNLRPLPQGHGSFLAIPMLITQAVRIDIIYNALLGKPAPHLPQDILPLLGKTSTIT